MIRLLRNRLLEPGRNSVNAVLVHGSLARRAESLHARVRSFKNQLILDIQASSLCPLGVRLRILRWWGIDCAANTTIWRNCRFGSPQIQIGPWCFLNQGVELMSTPDAPIVLGERVAIGMRALLVAAEHEIGGPKQRAGTFRSRPITVGEGCWIGAKAVVLPGVTIGPGCIIASGAVVTRDCEPNGLYAGVPARRIRELPDH